MRPINGDTLAAEIRDIAKNVSDDETKTILELVARMAETAPILVDLRCDMCRKKRVLETVLLAKLEPEETKTCESCKIRKIYDEVLGKASPYINLASKELRKDVQEKLSQ